tara:strand:- start:4000 stop:5232 length:1233 start_codon:yes stop_codon:yes gene_type:complete
MSQVGNKNIDNASGQVVRLDIQNTLAAVATNNFGQRNDAGTILPCEFLADDTSNKLLIRKSTGGDQANPNPTTGTAADFFTVGNLDEDNLGLLSKEGGAMTGPILANEGNSDHAGNASAPSVAFNTDPDTGMFRQASDAIGFACGGLERFKINGDGIHVVGNNSNALALSMLDANNDRAVNIRCPNVLANNYNLTLPPAIVGGGFLSTDGNGQLSFQIIAGVPTGAVFCMADNQSTATGYQANGIPDGYLECSGQTVSRTTFSALFAVIGTRYGAGNGSTTFQVPDLRGEFVRGFDNGRGADSGRSIGTSQTQDNRVHSHVATSTSSTTQSVHAHQYNISHVTTSSVQARTVGTSDLRMCLIDITNGNFGVGGTIAANANIGAIGTTTTIANDGSESRPRNVAMFYIIKV